jgi:alpha-L-arabinofuranosidase
LIVKVVNRGNQSATLALKLDGAAPRYARGQRIELSAASPTDENTFDQPTKIAPKVTPLPAFINGGSQAFPPCSVTVLRWSRM